MPGSVALIQFLTESLLRGRLRKVVLIFLVAAIVWLGIDLLAGQAFGLLFQIPWLVVLAGVAALLYSRRPLPLPSLCRCSRRRKAGRSLKGRRHCRNPGSHPGPSPA